MKNLILLVISGFFTLSSLCEEYSVLNYGAVNNGNVLTTSALQKAIDDCANHGGGTVLVPPGVYLTGTLNLRSDVELHLEAGSIIKATTDLKQYQVHNEQPSGLFYTENAENVSITGKGLINGQGIEFMYKDSAKFIKGEVNKYIRQKYDFRKVESGLGDGPLMPKDRYHQMIIFSDCRNVSIKDIRVADAPYWTFLIVHCDHVVISGLTIENNLMIPNNDGIDIVSSSNVNVSDCIITCGDDAIVLAGYAHHFGDPGFKDILKPSKNINVTNCILQSRSSGIRIGGWDQNSMSDYNFSNITITNSNCGINITVRDSGSVQHVNFSNIRIETRLHTGDWWGNGEPIKISAMRGVPNDRIGIINDIHFTNISCIGENTILLYASDESRLQKIYFDNFSFILRKSALEDQSGGNFDLRPNIIPGKEIFASDIPAVYIQNADDVSFNMGNIGWEGVTKEYHTYAIEAIGVNRLSISDTRAAASPSNPKLEPVSLKSCTGSSISINK